MNISINRVKTIKVFPSISPLLNTMYNTLVHIDMDKDGNTILDLPNGITILDFENYAEFLNTGTINNMLNIDLLSYMGHEILDDLEFMNIRLMLEWIRESGDNNLIPGHVRQYSTCHKEGPIRKYLTGLDYYSTKHNNEIHIHIINDEHRDIFFKRIGETMVDSFTFTYCNIEYIISNVRRISDNTHEYMLYKGTKIYKSLINNYKKYNTDDYVKNVFQYYMDVKHVNGNVEVTSLYDEYLNMYNIPIRDIRHRLFHKDNVTYVIGCLVPQYPTINSNIYLANKEVTNKDILMIVNVYPKTKKVIILTNMLY